MQNATPAADHFRPYHQDRDGNLQTGDGSVFLPCFSPACLVNQTTLHWQCQDGYVGIKPFDLFSIRFCRIILIVTLAGRSQMVTY